MINKEASLSTKRLYLRPRILADLEACIAMDRDAKVTQYIPGPWNDHPDNHKSFILNKMNEINPYPLGYWSIFHTDDLDTFLGWVMIVPIKNEQKKLEIGWRLTRNAWGFGYATEAAKQVLEITKNKFSSHEIIAYIDPKNKGSIKIAKKIGMSIEHEKKSEDVMADLICAIKNPE